MQRISSKQKCNRNDSLKEQEKKFIRLCSIPLLQAIGEMESSFNGLNDEEALARLDTYGFNELPVYQRRSMIVEILNRFKSPLNIQLLVISLVCFIIKDIRSALVVSGMITLSVGLSYFLDYRSCKAVESLGRRVKSRAFVLRNGKEKELKISEIVPGDIVILHAGSIVPADLRLIQAKDFFVSESTFTGESMPVEKVTCDSLPFNVDATPIELPNACFFGTWVTSGTAKGLVINTGSNTMLGLMTEYIKEERDTEFERGIRDFTLMMMRFMLVMVCFIFLLVGISKGKWMDAFLFGLSVSVGLTPEMLPMILTVNLAKGALSMAEKKVIVKHLPSIQNLGSIDILCTDKTGTLTQDRVVLERHVDVVGNVSEDVLHYAYLNSYFQTGLRNLIDRAVLEYVELDTSKCKLVDELPFDFQRRRMSVVVEYEGQHVLICKGAVEEIYSCCNRYQIGEEIFPLVEMIRADLFEEVENLNSDGFRVLGIAYREFPKEKVNFTIADETELVLLGYIAFFDPPKATAGEALELLSKLGVKVKVLTGDNALVTAKICKDVGLKIEKMVSGAELLNMSKEEFASIVEEANAFVKLTPLQKASIVEELMSHGHVVGYIGDGINDVPALKAADVGISVDSSVDIAKESSDIVLLEKSLTVMSEGIREGRRIFANIIKYIRMGASSNFGNMFSVVGASFLLPFLPMQPVHILINNFLYDLSQTGIPTDTVDEEIIAKPLKWNIQSIKRFMIFLGPVSSIFDYSTFLLMWFFFGCRRFLDPAIDLAGKVELERMFQTGWFVESLLTQTLIVHIIRTRRIPFIESQASGFMMLLTVSIMAVGCWLPYSPLSGVFKFVALPPLYWLWITFFILSYCILAHIVKMWFFRKYGDNNYGYSS